MPDFQPYVESIDTTGCLPRASCPPETYEDYDLTELAPLVRANLQATIRVEMTRDEQDSHFIIILQRCQHTLRQRYHKIREEQSVRNERPESKGRERSLPVLLLSEARLNPQNPGFTTTNTRSYDTLELPCVDAETDTFALRPSNGNSPQTPSGNLSPEFSSELSPKSYFCCCHSESQSHRTQRGETASAQMPSDFSDVFEFIGKEGCEECEILHNTDSRETDRLISLNDEDPSNT